VGVSTGIQYNRHWNTLKQNWAGWRQDNIIVMSIILYPCWYPHLYNNIILMSASSVLFQGISISIILYPCWYSHIFTIILSWRQPRHWNTLKQNWAGWRQDNIIVNMWVSTGIQYNRHWNTLKQEWAGWRQDNIIVKMWVSTGIQNYCIPVDTPTSLQ
jgi:3-methyladenine DNA glycosylase AlkD